MRRERERERERNEGSFNIVQTIGVCVSQFPYMGTEILELINERLEVYKTKK